MDYKQSYQEPFSLAKIENKIRIVVGNNVVSNKSFDTFKQAEQYIGTKPYELILNTSLLMFKQMQDYEKTIKKTKKNAKSVTKLETTKDESK